MRLLSWIRQIAPALLLIVVIGGAIAVMQSLSRTMDYHTVIHVLRAMKITPVFASIVATLLSYAALLGATLASYGLWAYA